MAARVPVGDLSSTWGLRSIIYLAPRPKGLEAGKGIWCKRHQSRQNIDCSLPIQYTVVKLPNKVPLYSEHSKWSNLNQWNLVKLHLKIHRKLLIVVYSKVSIVTLMDDTWEYMFERHLPLLWSALHEILFLIKTGVTTVTAAGLEDVSVDYDDDQHHMRCFFLRSVLYMNMFQQCEKWSYAKWQ